MLQIKQRNAGSRAEWLVDTSYTFGSGKEANFRIQAVEAHAATLTVDGDNLTLVNTAGSAEVKVNGATVKREAFLGADDQFSVGEAEYVLLDPKSLRAKHKAHVDSAPPPPSGWSLKALNTALATKRFDLKEKQSIGRSNDCAICLNVVHLSRRHAQITVKENHLQVDDLNSSNGTFVNGKRIKSAQVKSGDELTFDTLRFSVIGPHFDAEKTQMRMTLTDTDGDMTTMRQSIDPATLNALKTKNAAKSGPNRAAVSAQQAGKEYGSSVRQKQEQPVKSDKKSNVKAISAALILIAAVAAIAYYFVA
ncbi:MAG: pSer/pThr/pTyr-binding forkhead associated (FHA) protein [Flavobacteriales bacterium]|jgi:pSer/pThr/pTyr-binding forkhead associated (FHA) protein